MVVEQVKTQGKVGVSSQAQQKTTIQEYPLERRKIAKRLTVAMVFWVLFLGIGVVITRSLDLSTATFMIIFYSVLAVFFVVFILQLWYQTEYFKRYYYNIEPDFLIIKKGVITPHETMLPYEKIQDVYMDQDIFDRMFNLWDVHVSTATAMSGNAAHIDGVNRENADKLRELILHKIRKER